MMEYPGVATDPGVHTKNNLNPSIEKWLLKSIAMLMVVIPGCDDALHHDTKQAPGKEVGYLINIEEIDQINNKI